MTKKLTIAAPIIGAVGIGILWAAIGLFITVGSLVSSTGIDNLTGEYGTNIAVGTVLQVLGVAPAFVAGTVATERNCGAKVAA